MIRIILEKRGVYKIKPLHSGHVGDLVTCTTYQVSINNKTLHYESTHYKVWVGPALWRDVAVAVDFVRPSVDRHHSLRFGYDRPSLRIDGWLFGVLKPLIHRRCNYCLPQRSAAISSTTKRHNNYKTCIEMRGKPPTCTWLVDVW